MAVSHRMVPSETGSGTCENLQQGYSLEVKSNESKVGWSFAMAVKLIELGVNIEAIGRRESTSAGTFSVPGICLMSLVN